MEMMDKMMESMMSDMSKEEKEEMMGPALKEIFLGVMDGRWKPIMDRSFPLDRDGAVEAHQYLHDRKNLGKVVLEAPA